MISTEIRNLVASMKAHADCETITPAVFNVFIGRLQQVANNAEDMEAQMVPPHLRGSFRLRSEDDNENVVAIRPHLRRAPAKRSGGDGAA